MLVEHERMSEEEAVVRNQQAALMAMGAGMAMGGGDGAKKFLEELMKPVKRVTPGGREESEDVPDEHARRNMAHTLLPGIEGIDLSDLS